MAPIVKRLAALGLVLAAACSEVVPSAQPPLNQFYFPTGLAVRKLPSGQVALLVVSSNFDLRYQAASGGTLIAVDPDDKSVDGGDLFVLGAIQLGSFGGEVAVVDDTTCPGWTATSHGSPPLALVASRSSNTLYRFEFRDDGSLTCGDGCVVPLTPSLADPFGVTVACTPQKSSAFVSYLRTPNNEGWLTEYDLGAGTKVDHDVGASPTYSGAYDLVASRLYVTSRFATVGSSPFRWLDLPAAEALSTVNLNDAVRGSETAGIALSHDRTRAYVALKIYDTTTTGGATPNVTAALAVLDITPDASGTPVARVIRTVPVDRGADRVAVLPARPVPGSSPPATLRDLVVVACEDDHSVVLYDDEVGAVVRTFAVETVPPVPPSTQPGVKYTVGKQPYGLAVEAETRTTHCLSKLTPEGNPGGGPCDRVYVGVFEQHIVQVIEVDPEAPSSSTIVKQLGRVH